MKHWLVSSRLLAAVIAGALLGGCAHRAPPPPAQGLLDDALFGAPTEVIDSSSIFALNDAMRRYADTLFAARSTLADPRRDLISALYQRGLLNLSYEASVTRNAAQAFEARAGNCLSLVLMTAAFAKHLGLPVSYRNVLLQETYSRSSGLLLANGHVNVVLDRLPRRMQNNADTDQALVVDFMPVEERSSMRSLPLDEGTLVAMFFNNRAAEALAAGRLDDAYAWARASVLQDPGYGAGINTLAVVYMRAGHLPQAERALQHALLQQPDSTAALSNLRAVLLRADRPAEAAEVGARLARLQPYPPFYFLELGRQAMNAGDYRAARDLIARELRQQPFQHEVHFWAAQADWALGQRKQALAHLDLARDYSLTEDQQRLYAGKLDALRGLQNH
jgi:tetratricopeptide (TPR) repeat protein